MKDDNKYYRLNAARCKICNTVVIATKNGELNHCHCGNLIVTGDLSFSGLVRYIKQIDIYREQYEELSQYDTGHPVSDGHVIINPQSALDTIKRGRCFIQYHLNSRRMSWKMSDEYGQDLEVVEIQAGEDGNYSVSVRFRFRPVNCFNFYICGAMSQKQVGVFNHIMVDIIPSFLDGPQTRGALYKILIDNGYQDRTGMFREDEWRM
jgi:hypothetical protein